ncbi:MAG: hypothetical protein R3B06_15020 [Kofleriaceae bacterium]
MHDAIEALMREPAATVTITQGIEHFDDGQVVLRIRGSGDVAVTQRRAGTTTAFNGQLTRDELGTLVTALAGHRFSRPRTSKLPRNPGDTPLVLSYEAPGAAAATAALWYGDRYQDQELDAIIRVADDLIYRITGGQLGAAAAQP